MGEEGALNIAKQPVLLHFVYKVNQYVYLTVRCAGVLIVQVTDESHVDKPHLVGAVTAVTEVAAAINESKRRKELGTDEFRFHRLFFELKSLYIRNF